MSNSPPIVAIKPLPDGLPSTKSHVTMDGIEQVEFYPSTAPTYAEYRKAFAPKAKGRGWPYVVG